MVSLPEKGQALLAPRALSRIGALALCAVLVGLGGLALLEYSALAGIDAPAAAVAGDGPLRVSGEVANVYEQTSPSATTLYLRGAADLKFNFDGPVGRLYAVGDFVIIEGTKAGNVVEGDSIVRGVQPLAASLPYLLVGFAMLGMLVLDFVVPWWIALRPGTPAKRWDPVAPLRRMFKRRQAVSEGGPGGDDNHSGAPAPKG